MYMQEVHALRMSQATAAWLRTIDDLTPTSHVAGQADFIATFL